MERRLEIVIDPRKAISGAEQVTRATDKVTVAGNKAADSFKRLTKQFGSFSSEVRDLSRGLSTKSFDAMIKALEANNKAMDQVKRTTDQLRKSTDTLGKTTLVAAGKMEKATSELKNYDTQTRSIDKTNKKTTKGFLTFNQAVMGFALTVGSIQVGGLVADIGRALDTFTEWENKLAVVTTGTIDLTTATDELLQVSIRSRTDMSATMDLYSKMIRVNQQYGFSQKDILQITETVSQAVAMSGASVQSAQGAILQFAQALSGNFKSSAQELNSIIEQTPGLAQAVAMAIGTTTDQLKRLAKEGLIETKDVMAGLLRIAPELASQFERSNITISQSLGGLSDAFTNFLGQNEKLNSMSKEIGKSIQDIALSLSEYEDEIVTLGVALGTMATVTLPALLGAFVVMTGPVGWFITSVGLATAAITSMTLAFTAHERETDAIKEKTKELTGDYKQLALAVKDATLFQVIEQQNSWWEENEETYSRLKKSVDDYKTNVLDTLSKNKSIYETVDEARERIMNTDLGKRYLAEKAQLEELTKQKTIFSQRIEMFLATSENLDAALRNNARAYGDLGAEVEKTSISLEKYLNKLANPQVYKAYDDHIKRVKEIRETFKDQKEVSKAVAASFYVLQEELKKIEEATKTSTKTTKSSTKAVKDQRKTYEELLAVYDPLQRVTNDYYKEVQEIIDSKSDEEQKVKLVTLAYDKLQKAIADLNKPSQDALKAAKEREKAYEKEQKRLRDLAESYADTFMDGIRSAMEGLDSFKDWFKNHLKEMALMALRNQIILPITSQLVGGGSGSLLGGGSGGSMIGNLLGGVGPSGNILDIFTGEGFTQAASNFIGYFGGGSNPLQTQFTQFAQSPLGVNLGLGHVQNTELLAKGVDPKLFDSLTGFGETVSEALGMIGGGLTAYGVSQEHGPVAGTLAGVGSMTLGAGVGAMMSGGSFMSAAGAMLTNPVGWIVAGLGALFGMGKKPSDKTQYTSIDAATGQTFEQGFEGSKFDQEIRDFTTAMGNQIAALSNYMSATTDTVLEGFGLDLSVGQLSGLRLQRSDYETGEQVTLIQRGAEEAEAFMEDIENYLAEVYGMQIEVYRDLGKETESLLQSMIRLDGQVAAVKDAVDLVGGSFDVTGDDVIRYSDVIVSAAGGLESFTQGLLSFGQAMVTNTPGLQFLDQVSNLSGLFNDIGVSSLPTTNEGFQELLNSLDLTTEYGQTLYGALIKLAPQFFDFTASLENLFDVITPLTDLSQSIREQMMSEEELYNLRKTQAEDLAATLNTLTDPTEIANTVAEIERLTNQAWSGLSESQKQAMGEEFISFLEQTAAIATVQLENLTANAITEGATEEGVSQQQAADLSRQASENMALAADELSSASQALLAAARELSSFTANTQQGEREIDYR